MYFHKYPIDANFEFVKSLQVGKWGKLGPTKFRAQVTAFLDDVYRIRVESPRWPQSFSQAGLTPPAVLRKARDHDR